MCVVVVDFFRPAASSSAFLDDMNLCARVNECLQGFGPGLCLKIRCTSALLSVEVKWERASKRKRSTNTRMLTLVRALESTCLPL